MKEPPPHRVSDLSSKNTPEVYTLNSSLLHNIDDSISHKFPFRHNRGKSPNRYSSDREFKEEGIQLLIMYPLRDSQSL